MAMCNDPANVTAKWTLLDKSYKELRPYVGFKWPSDKAREQSVSNAIKAFDRMRIPKNDRLWDTLLPEEERGRGICLSRLNLREVAKDSKTPTMAPTRYDKKTGLPKKSEAKKIAEKKEKKEKAKEEKDDRAKVAKAVKPVARDPPVKDVKVSLRPDSRADSKPAPIKRTIEEPTRSKLAAGSPAVGDAGRRRSVVGDPKARDSRPSTAAKSLLNKPRNPSPLSKSPPVNASDFDAAHPVHKKLAAAPSPPRKRKSDEIDGEPKHNGLASKRQHIRTPSVNDHAAHAKSSQSSSSSSTDKSRDASRVRRDGADVTNKSLKRKAVDTDPRSRQAEPTKMRKIQVPQYKANGSHARETKRDIVPSAMSPETGTSSSDDNKPLKLTYKQALEMALRYEQYYPKYRDLYMEICASDDPPTKEKRAQLEQMHKKLKDMKELIAEASWRGRDGKGVVEK